MKFLFLSVALVAGFILGIPLAIPVGLIFAHALPFIAVGSLVSFPIIMAGVGVVSGLKAPLAPSKTDQYSFPPMAPPPAVETGKIWPNSHEIEAKAA